MKICQLSASSILLLMLFVNFHILNAVMCSKDVERCQSIDFCRDAAKMGTCPKHRNNASIWLFKMIQNECSRKEYRLIFTTLTV